MSLRDRLLVALPFSKYELDNLISSAPFRYKEYFIPKRQPGQFRLVSQPTPEVKLVQRWLINNEFKNFRIHECAKAYREGVGLLANVAPHKLNRYLLKIDFKNFFPSITTSNFRLAMVDTEYSKQDMNDLCNLLFKKDKIGQRLALAIGAPSSPTLSNILLYRLDLAIQMRCEKLGVIYTRYADDLSFSTNIAGVLSKLQTALPAIIRSVPHLDLDLNENKTVHTSKKYGRRITGLVITSANTVSVGRDTKRLIRSQVHHYSLGKLSDLEIAKLKGFLAYLKSVEPDFIERLSASYGQAWVQRLMQ